MTMCVCTFTFLRILTPGSMLTGAEYLKKNKTGIVII